MLDENDRAEADRVKKWDYHAQYGRQMWVKLKDGTEEWISLDCPLASELYARIPSDRPGGGFRPGLRDE